LLRVFCEFGILGKDEIIYETAISSLSDKIATNLREIESKNILLNHVDVHDTIRDD